MGAPGLISICGLFAFKAVTVLTCYWMQRKDRSDWILWVGNVERCRLFQFWRVEPHGELCNSAGTEDKPAFMHLNHLSTEQFFELYATAQSYSASDFSLCHYAIPLYFCEIQCKVYYCHYVDKRIETE